MAARFASNGSGFIPMATRVELKRSAVCSFPSRLLFSNGSQSFTRKLSCGNTGSTQTSSPSGASLSFLSNLFRIGRQVGM